jgi:hypothetical protein
MGGGRYHNLCPHLGSSRVAKCGTRGQCRTYKSIGKLLP